MGQASRPDVPKKNPFQEGEIVSVGLKGLYQVDSIENVKMGHQSQWCLVLKKIHAETIHKTFLPIDAIDSEGVRLPASKKTVTSWDAWIERPPFHPLDASWNSNKKIQAYQELITQHGLKGLIHALVFVRNEIQAYEDRSDKRYDTFQERLEKVAEQEIAYALNVDMAEARGQVEQILRHTCPQ